MSRPLANATAALRDILDGARGPVAPAIRAEIFGPERFAQHGRSLGATHGTRLAQRGSGSFFPRLSSNVEVLRKAGAVGSSLAAQVQIAAPEGDRLLLESLGDDLRFLLITSTASVETGEALAVRVTPSESAKCDRCWHYRSDVGTNAEHPQLCGRCQSNLFGAGEVRRHA